MENTKKRKKLNKKNLVLVKESNMAEFPQMLYIMHKKVVISKCSHHKIFTSLQNFYKFSLKRTVMPQRQTDDKIEREKDRKTERQKDRKTERQKDRKTERQKDRKTERDEID